MLRAAGAIHRISFFLDECQQQSDAALEELEVATNQAHSPDEPRAESRTVPQLNMADYQGSRGLSDGAVVDRRRQTSPEDI
jgi:hypothetical protein